MVKRQLTQRPEINIRLIFFHFEQLPKGRKTKEEERRKGKSSKRKIFYDKKIKSY